MTQKKVKVVFVCLGNICRSPVAEGTFNFLVSKKNLQSSFYVDSAGTSAWHIGDSANANSKKVARQHGINLTSRARQFLQNDFVDFNHIIAMDQNNYNNILQLSPTPEDKKKVTLMRKYDDQNTINKNKDVPDPYYGGIDGFEDVQKILLVCCANLLDDLIKLYNIKNNH